MSAEDDAALQELVAIFQSISGVIEFARATRSEYLEVIRNALFADRGLVECVRIGLVDAAEVATTLLDRLEQLAQRELRPRGAALTLAEEEAVARMTEIVEQLSRA